MQFRKKPPKPSDRRIDRVLPALPVDAATCAPRPLSPPRFVSVPPGFQLALFVLRSPLSRLAPVQWDPTGQVVRKGRSGAIGRTECEPGSDPSPESSVLRLVLDGTDEVGGPREVFVRQPDGPGTPLAITTPGTGEPHEADGRHGPHAFESGDLPDSVLAVLQQMLRLDEDYELFYRLAAQDPQLDWAPACDAARVLRSATAFEDLVKCLLLGVATEARAAALCEALCGLGKRTVSGRRAFPGPAELAACSVEDFVAMGAGRLARPLHRLVALCASGTLHAETLRRQPARLAAALDEAIEAEGQGDEGQTRWDDLVHEELEWQERVRALLEWLPGFGERAVGEMLLLLGCYEDVQLHPTALRRFGRRSPRRAPPRTRSSKPARPDASDSPGELDPARARADGYRFEVQRLLRRLERYGLYRGLAQALLGADEPRPS